MDLWVEKYRPRTVEDYVFQNEQQKEQVDGWIAKKSIPHILFSGSPGTGKTTLALLLIEAIGIQQHDLLTLNASRERKIETVRDRIATFSGTIPFGDLKVVFLDEADYLTPEAQASLRGTMEENASTCRFMLTCNYPHKIIPALHSRCPNFHIEKLIPEEFTVRAAKVLLAESIEFDVEVLDTYVKATYPDLRKCINLLQNNSTTGQLRVPGKTDTAIKDFRLDAVTLFKEGKVREARQLICTQAQAEDMDSMFRWFYDNLNLWSPTPEGQDKAIQIIRDGLVNHSLVADVEINIAATLTELCDLRNEK